LAQVSQHGPQRPAPVVAMAAAPGERPPLTAEPMDVDNEGLAAVMADAAAAAGAIEGGPVRKINGKLVGSMVDPNDNVLEPIQVLQDLPDDDDQDEQPEFPPVSAEGKAKKKREFRRIPVPHHRLTPLKTHWKELIAPLVEHMKLQVRMNTKRRCIEMKIGPNCADIMSLTKSADFCKAFMLGFDLQDAIALLRLDDLFIESFEVKDVKRLQGDHLSRCIGRMAGKDGKTKYAIENATRTRIVIADEKIHILGSFSNIKLARDAICNLILGSQPGKVYQHLRTVSKRIQERL